MGWDLDRTLAFWTAAGIDHVGVPFAKLEAAGGDAAVARVAERVAERGLTVGNLIGPGPFHLDDRGSWPAQQDRFRWIVDAAAVLQAGCVVFTTGRAGGLTWEQAADALEDALDPVVAHAADRGVALALEHTNSLRPDIGFVHRLRDAVDLARRLGIGVCMEINACWLERALDDTVADGVDTFRLVQVSDFVLGTVDTPNRAVPGDGDIPLRRILGQVVAAAYTGAFDLEIIGPRIEQEGYESAVRRSVDNVAAVLNELGA